MIPHRLVVACLRLYRLTLTERQAAAEKSGRHCCAMTLAAVRADVTATIAHIADRRETP